jgi:hypothetical protein
MSSTLTNLQQANNWATIDNVVSVNTDALYIDGKEIDPGNFVPYTGASATVNLNSQNITTTHVPATGADLTNKTYVDAAVITSGAGKVPYTGATSNVNLGTYSLTSAALNTTALTASTATLTGLVAGTPAYTVGINTSNQLITYTPASSPFSGTVSAGYVPYASSTNTFANSLLSQSGSTLTNTGNLIVLGTVALDNNAIVTAETPMSWSAPYLTATGGVNVLSYTYTSGQGFGTSTIGAATFSLPGSGTLVGYNVSYTMTITGFKTSAPFSGSVSFEILQGLPIGTAVSVYNSGALSTPTVATNYTFNFNTVANGTDLSLRVNCFAGASSSALVYFNTMAVKQLQVQLQQTNVAGSLNVIGTASVSKTLYTTGISNTGTIVSSGTSTASEYILSGITLGSSGLESELTNILDLGLNFRGSNVISTNLGGGFRIDGRAAGNPLFGWWYRPASGSDTQLMNLTSSGDLTVTGTVYGYGGGVNGTGYLPGMTMKSTSAKTASYSVGQDDTHSVFLSWVYNATAANGYGRIQTYAGSNSLCLQDAGGYVGIGKTNPSAFLDVTGNIVASTSITAGSSLTVGTSASVGSTLVTGASQPSGISMYANYGSLVVNETFYVGGANSSTFYPCFIDTLPAWDTGVNSAIFEIGRSNVHEDATWTGAFQYEYTGHNTRWGNEAQYMTHKYTCNSGASPTYKIFIANVVQDPTSSYVVVWLRGNITYHFSSRNGCNLVFFPKSTTPWPQSTGVGNNTSYTYTTTTTSPFEQPTFEFDTRYVSIPWNGVTNLSGYASGWVLGTDNQGNMWRGQCNGSQVYKNQNISWAGGVNITNAFNRLSPLSAVYITGRLSCYATTGTWVYPAIRLYHQASGTYFYYYISTYQNLAYSQTNYPISLMLGYNADLVTKTGLFDIYVYNGGGCSTDINDQLEINIAMFAGNQW